MTGVDGERLAGILTRERCVPCESGTSPLDREAAEALLRQISDRWRLADDGRSIEREIVFKSFGRAMAFLNRLADLAEVEGHHPDFCLYGWNRVKVTLSTHAIGGLSRNDFILAAKADAVVSPPTSTTQA